MPKLNHFDLNEYPSFVTTKTAGNVNRFSAPELAELVVESLLFGNEEDWYDLISFVVMPDHLHFIVVPGDRSLSDIVSSIKGYTAKKVNGELDRKGPVWKDGFYDYVLDTREKLVSRIQYIENNPVEAEIAENPEDYSYSGINYREELDADEYLK